jgi:4-hydroxyacetophenone monooxygenase
MRLKTAVDAAFIRRALEIADLNAVRIALYQQTEDPWLAALPIAAKCEAADTAILIDKATAWLLQNAGGKAAAETPEQPPEQPSEQQLRRLMNMATGIEMDDLEFAARRDLPAFGPYPFFAQWEGDKPPVPEDFKVAIIGSGFSGIAAAVQFELLGLPYVVLERQPEPGGTWTINRYPDVRVDTPSITYEYSFEKAYRWTEYFGRGGEVQSYLAHVAEKYGVAANTRYNTDLERASFDAGRQAWRLELATPDGPQTLYANVVISAAGVFANPRLPDFPGKDSFKGAVVHPSRWPQGLDLSGKRVAIMGNGSTGVQILGTIASQAEAVHVFQRTPQWISPRANYGKKLEPEISWLVENFPGYWNWWRYMATAALFDIHNFQVPDPAWQAGGGKINAANDQLRETLTGYIHREMAARPELIEKLIPDYAPFSRRPVVDNGWYRALTRDNVELVTEPIERLHPHGIETADGRQREVDIIVSATGFEITQYLWPARYTGRDGQDLHDAWSAGDGPRAYLGMMVPDFPNMFMLYGPNSQPLSGGTGLPQWYVVWAAYAARCIMQMLRDGKKTVEVTQAAYRRYNEALDKEAANLIQLKVEGGVEKNYYVSNGRLLMNAPWLSPVFHRMCSVVDWTDLALS